MAFAWASACWCKAMPVGEKRNPAYDRCGTLGSSLNSAEKVRASLLPLRQ